MPVVLQALGSTQAASPCLAFLCGAAGPHLPTRLIILMLLMMMLAIRINMRILSIICNQCPDDLDLFNKPLRSSGLVDRHGYRLERTEDKAFACKASCADHNHVQGRCRAEKTRNEQNLHAKGCVGCSGPEVQMPQVPQPSSRKKPQQLQ